MTRFDATTWALSENQRTLFAARIDQLAPAQRAAWTRLRRLLDAVAPGSTPVPLPEGDPDLIELVTFGREHDPTGARFVAMRPNDCHDNAEELRWAGLVACVGVGYGLSADGLWRQHSWGIDTSGRIVETTEMRLAWWGVAR